jgi:hypothetical protein
MQHARTNPSSTPAVSACLRVQARLITRPQLLTRSLPLRVGRGSSPLEGFPAHIQAQVKPTPSGVALAARWKLPTPHHGGQSP